MTLLAHLHEILFYPSSAEATGRGIGTATFTSTLASVLRWHHNFKKHVEIVGLLSFSLCLPYCSSKLAEKKCGKYG